MQGPFISFVIPIFNEEKNIVPLISRLTAVCTSQLWTDYEIILVENGSDDNSEIIIREIQKRNARVQMLQLSRNFGYQGALAAGLKYARGEWIAVLDGDQQDPPEIIPTFMIEAEKGFDVVYGIRAKRKEPAWKRFAYAMFYRIWKNLSDTHVPVDAGDFCLMRRTVVNQINELGERQRFIRGLRAWVGFKQTGVMYERDARSIGDSKFNVVAMIKLAFDGILAFSVVPLRMMLICGAFVSLASFAIGSFHLVVRILSWLGLVSPLLEPGMTELNLLITGLLGFIILCLGIIGEYVGRIYDEVKRRPLFIVRRHLTQSTSD